MDRDDFDVTIVGGGPAGLWLACELALARIRVCVLERRIERVPQSRALTIHGRSIELFALRGIADRFLSQGKPIPTGHFGVLETRLDFSDFQSRFPFTLFLAQTVTEGVLEERALELGVAIRRGHEVQAIQALADKAIVTGASGETSFRLSSAYLIGADGARSIVRSQAEIGFEGYAARNTMMLGDVVLGAPPEVPAIMTTNTAGSMMIVPLGDGVHHRIVLLDPTRAQAPQNEPLTLGELSNSVARIAGVDYGLRDPIWLSRFADETRLAEKYRRGRIFLVGDAAHIHAPMGGQGMNVGLQDAMNLGWKLAHVIKGTAPDSLLDTYEAERRCVGERLYFNTLAQVALITNLDHATMALRQTLNDLLKIPEANRKFADDLSGFGVSYAKPVVAVPIGWQYIAGVSGNRLIDQDLSAPGKWTSLYDASSTGDWLLLQFGQSTALTRDLPPELIALNLPAAPEGSQFSGIRAALVRPDGYVDHVIAR